MLHHTFLSRVFTFTKKYYVLFIECTSYISYTLITQRVADAVMYVPRETTIINGAALTSNSRAIVQNQINASIISYDKVSMSRIIFENISIRMSY